MSEPPKYANPYPAQGDYQGPPVVAPPQYASATQPQRRGTGILEWWYVDLRSNRDSGDGATNSTNADGDAEGAKGVGANNRDSSSSYQRYDMYTTGCSLDRAGPSFLVASVDCIHTSAPPRYYHVSSY
ncbi:hypothetical protein SASPL_155671 [Salvia splendens]|uniref:Uncharacterized protein n=1 Tax=Salvia splendens TaxID=180675 RepID=A0A8X8YY03_SALSN|nr:hypothetical protein SASPL_155671 [Salvia splendens]